MIKVKIVNIVWKNEKINLCRILEPKTIFTNKKSNIKHFSLTNNFLGDKTERYNRDFLVKNENKKYKLIEMYDLIYNPSNLKFGSISINFQGTGMVSPIYNIYEIKEMNFYYALHEIIKSKKFIEISKMFQQGTVYERMQVIESDFLRLKVPKIFQNDEFKIKTILDIINKSKKILSNLKYKKKFYIKSLLL